MRRNSAVEDSGDFAGGSGANNQAKQEEARKPVRRGAGRAVPCPYMGRLIVGRLVRTF